MTTYSLDSDINTRLLKKHPGNQPVVARFRKEIECNSAFVICPVVCYEMRRELVFKEALTQLAAFQALVDLMAWREFNTSIWNRACDLWSTLRAEGRSHHDADVLIAAHALHYGAVVVSANMPHFRTTGVPIENWNAPSS